MTSFTVECTGTRAELIEAELQHKKMRVKVLTDGGSLFTFKVISLGAVASASVHKLREYRAIVKVMEQYSQQLYRKYRQELVQKLRLKAGVNK